jgi:hypothetical protein
LQSRHVSPTNTLIQPVALTKAELQNTSKFVTKAMGQ